MRALSPKTLRQIHIALSLAAVRAVDAMLDRTHYEQLAAVVEGALAPRRGQAARRKAKALRFQSTKLRRLAVREAAFERADGACEARGSFCLGAATELDHFRGRGREESIESCWATCRNCHAEKTINRPDAAFWLRRFIAHCESYGYSEQKRLAENRLAFVEARKGAA